MLLPTVMVTMLVGALVIAPWLSIVGRSVNRTGQVTAAEEAYYAADAGIQAVVRDLRLGLNPLAPGYIVPTLTVNGLTPSITVTAPATPATILAGPALVDPEATGGLSVLAPGAEFLYQLNDVEPNTPLEVNWAFTPDSRWRVTVFQGAGTGGLTIADRVGRTSPANVTVRGDAIAGGTFTIRFRNRDDANTITTSPFSVVGAGGGTWIRTKALRSFLITSTAEGQTLQVLARQGPGPTQDRRSVQIASFINLPP